MKRLVLISSILCLSLSIVGCSINVYTQPISQEKAQIQVQAGEKPDKWERRDGSRDWDSSEGRKIKKAVIHHSATDPGITWQTLSDLQKASLYGPRYRSSDPDPYVKGDEPESGHWRLVDNEWIQVFYAYQWLIRPDGKPERLLRDDEIGWQAGDWPTNCEAVAICLTGDYSQGRPSEAALNTCAQLLANYVKKFPAMNAELEKSIVGHREVNKKTVCPGNEFLGSGGWKEVLIKKVQAILVREIEE